MPKETTPPDVHAGCARWVVLASQPTNDLPLNRIVLLLNGQLNGPPRSSSVNLRTFTSKLEADEYREENNTCAYLAVPDPRKA